ncbi:hypothetical protein [Pendulispora albinea]|uniref:Uncharacterized protein n=1 Tax=Pendulispora albinea TaxID=2741071 RepID=A0ABZ2LLZ5_9BACT
MRARKQRFSPSPQRVDPSDRAKWSDVVALGLARHFRREARALHSTRDMTWKSPDACDSNATVESEGASFRAMARLRASLVRWMIVNGLIALLLAGLTMPALSAAVTVCHTELVPIADLEGWRSWPEETLFTSDYRLRSEWHTGTGEQHVFVQDAQCPRDQPLGIWPNTLRPPGSRTHVHRRDDTIVFAGEESMNGVLGYATPQPIHERFVGAFQRRETWRPVFVGGDFGIAVLGALGASFLIIVYGVSLAIDARKRAKRAEVTSPPPVSIPEATLASYRTMPRLVAAPAVERSANEVEKQMSERAIASLRIGAVLAIGTLLLFMLAAFAGTSVRAPAHISRSGVL